jgi:hypothetical protein
MNFKTIPYFELFCFQKYTLSAIPMVRFFKEKTLREASTVNSRVKGIDMQQGSSPIAITGSEAKKPKDNESRRAATRLRWQCRVQFMLHQLSTRQ